MIAITTMAAVIAVSVVCALVGAVFFWLDHNAKNGLKMKENPLAVKWIVGALLAGLAVAGVFLWRMKDADLGWEDALCGYGVILGICAVFLAKIFNEGIGAFAKYAKQKTEEVVEAADDFSAVSENIDKLANCVTALTEKMTAIQEDNDAMKKRLGL